MCADAHLRRGITLADERDVVVLREGGEYLQRRERRLWGRFIVGSVASIGLGIALILKAHYAIALAAIPAAMALAMLAAPHLERVRKGRRGERVVTDLL